MFTWASRPSPSTLRVVTVIGTRPALTISRMSSSSNTSGASSMTTAAFPRALSWVFTLVRLSYYALALRTNTLWPARSFTAAMAGAPGPRDHHLAHVRPRPLGEGGDRFQFGPNGRHGCDHVDLAEVARFEVRVQIALERLQSLVRQPALLPLIDEVVCAVERHAGANDTALDHLVEATATVVAAISELARGTLAACRGCARRRSRECGRRQCRTSRCRRRRSDAAEVDRARR